MLKSVEKISEKITHITYVADNGRNENDFDRCDFYYEDRKVLSQTRVSFMPKTIYRYEVDGEPVLRRKMTANGEVTYIENEKEVPWKESYSIEVTFTIGESEILTGLGQYEDGIFDYRNRREYLYESNMRIAIPLLITTGGYGILIDSGSGQIFESNKNEISFYIDADSKLSYYIFFGTDIPDIIRQYHSITGMPSMLPRWAFGYIQSKERYNDSEEILDIARNFRERDIPIDCIVQDWFTWEEGLWGEKIFDKKRYPDLQGMTDALHKENIKFMVSIWPNMNPDTTNYAQFMNVGKLLPNSNVYDAFDENARSIYWQQCMEEIMSSGTDALWCDNSEPFSDADWSGQFKKEEEERYKAVTQMSQKSMDWEQLNTFGLYHARGIYENWRQTYQDKRVVNLTRSGYSGCQKYGTILWSGDITATWDTLRKQIVEGMKMSLCGMPYWTLDIGGFFVVKDKYENRGCNDTAHLPLWFWNGDYNDGVDDLGYRELYTRWLQFGAFLPIFRSHGTDTPREPWRFGDKGDIFYDTIVSFIRLRYKLMPYIYSLAAKAHFEGEMIMRSLIMDYAEDPKCAGITDEYMFGDAFLVAPVCKPMYYEAGSKMIQNSKLTRIVYLPKGNGWYDYYTNEYYEGGTWVEADAALPKMPLFVRAGAIIPVAEDDSKVPHDDLEVPHDDSEATMANTLVVGDEVLGASAPVAERLNISDLAPGINVQVYPGCDGHFVLYLDAGDGYGFEKGEYRRIELNYSDETKSLTVPLLFHRNAVPR